MTFERGGRLVEMRGLGRDDAEVGVSELGRIGRRLEAGGEVVAAGDAQAVLVERPRVLLAARENDNVGDLR
jgi:hypothetical protein